MVSTSIPEQGHHEAGRRIRIGQWISDESVIDHHPGPGVAMNLVAQPEADGVAQTITRDDLRIGFQQ